MASVAKQANRLPDHGQKCQTKAAEKRYNRTPETFQATINGRAKDGQAEHKKDCRDRCAARDLLWSILALMKRIRRRHSWMLAAEMAAPVANMAASRQPEAFQSTSAASAPTINVMRMARFSRACRPSSVKAASAWGSSVMIPIPAAFAGLGGVVVLHFGIFIGGQGQADRVDQPGDAAKDDSNNRDPGLMEVVVEPCSDEPADKSRAGQHERDLHQLFGLDPGAEKARTFAVLLRVGNGAVVGHPS